MYRENFDMKTLRPLFCLLYGALLLLGIPGVCLAQETDHDLFLSTNQVGVRKVPLTPTMQRRRAVTINWALLERLAAGLENNAALHLFPDLAFEIEITNREYREKESYSLFGTVKNSPWSSVVLTRIADGLALSLQTSEGVNVELQNAGGGIFQIVQLEWSNFRPCGGALRPEELPTQQPGRISIQATTEFDVVLYYTPMSRTAAGGTNQILAVCQQAIDVANNSYANSGVDVRCNLLRAKEIAYTEVTNNTQTNRDRLTNPSDGYMDTVHAERNYYGADLVGLVCELTDSCGQSYIEPNNAVHGFFVVARECAVGNLSLAHEMGHNMGCGHDAASGSGISSYSHGWKFTANSTLYRTVMAYPSGIRIPYFSNPNVNYLGVATGDATEADNARTIREHILSVSEFRARSYFVDGVLGLDTNIGTEGAPFRTVTRALNGAGNTATTKIYVKAGNYGADRPRTTKKVSYRNWGNTGLSRIGKP